MSRKLVVALILPVLVACNKEEEPGAPAPEPQPAPGIDLSGLPPPSQGEITGELRLAPAVASKVVAGDSIYVMARNAATGAVVAVTRLSAPEKFPLPFTLSGSHTMEPGSGLFGKVRLQARVDKDGDAVSKNPGDVFGEAPDLVEVPSSGVVLTLDQVL